jgi:hypothetical protein
MRLRQILPVLGGSVLLGACGFADLFSTRQVGNVVITYAGPTSMRVDDRAPFAVTVTIDGAAIPNPRLSITNSDPTVLTLLTDGDTLVALNRGLDTLRIRLVSSMYTDSFPTLLQQVRVNP